MQTIGSRGTFKDGKINADAALYLQTGKSLDKSISALYFGGNFGYKITDHFSAGLGGEYLSGTDMNATNNDITLLLLSLEPTINLMDGWIIFM